MRLVILLSGFFAVMLLSMKPVFAYCSAPNFFERVPEAPNSFDRPSIPVCMKDRDRECADRDVDDYERKVEDYIRKLETYVADVNKFSSDVNDHAGNAKRYAECEVRDINSHLR
jgi:hypothetical protein